MVMRMLVWVDGACLGRIQEYPPVEGQRFFRPISNTVGTLMTLSEAIKWMRAHGTPVDHKPVRDGSKKRLVLRNAESAALSRKFQSRVVVATERQLARPV